MNIVKAYFSLPTNLFMCPLMDMIFKNNIKQLRISKGLSQAKLGEIIGRDQSLISKLEKGQIDFDMNMADKLSAAFGVPIDHLRMPPKESSLHLPNLGSISEAQFGPGTVPILGHANGSHEAIVINMDSVIGQAPRHPNQHGLRDGFALYAAGESMSPRYRSGELVYVAAKKPPISGQDCVVEMNNTDGFLKEFVRYTEKEIICKQLNPPKDWKRPLSEIKAVHAVVGRG